MEDFGLVLVCFIIGFVVAVVTLNDTTNEKWAKDCEQAGVHRYENKVFTCHLKESK